MEALAHRSIGLLPRETGRRSEVASGTDEVSREAIVRTLREYLEPSRGPRSAVVPFRRARERRLGAPPTQLHRLEARSTLARAVRTLEPRERLLLFRAYVEDVPLSRVAAELGVSRSYVYKLRDRAFAKLAGLDLPTAAAY